MDSLDLSCNALQSSLLSLIYRRLIFPSKPITNILKTITENIPQIFLISQNLIGQTLVLNPILQLCPFLDFLLYICPRNFTNSYGTLIFFESICYRTMESINSSPRDYPLLPSRILIVFDATKNCSSREFRRIINNLRMRGGIVHPGDTIIVLGVVHRVLHPLGYQMGVLPDNFFGTTHTRAIGEEVLKKIDMYSAMLQHSAEECEEEGVDIEVKITAGAPRKRVVMQEVATSNAAWVIFDRHLRRGLKFYLKHIPCKVALVRDNLLVDVLRPYYSNKELEYIEHKQFYSLSRPVPRPLVSDSESNEESIVTSDSEINEQSIVTSDSENTEQSVITVSYHGSMPFIDGSDVSTSSSISTVTSNSKEKGFSSRAEYGSKSNPKQGDSGLERDSTVGHHRETFSPGFIYQYLRKSAIKFPRTGEITQRNY